MNEKEVLNYIQTTPFIDGCYVAPGNGELIQKYCPANGESIPSITCSGEDVVDKAVDNAMSIYDSGVWRNCSSLQKKTVLMKWAELIEENSETIAYMDALETGRCIENFLTDSIPKAIAAIRWFAEAADKLVDESVDHDNGTITTVSRSPLGVVGVIIPWNDPLVVAAWKIAPALLMGNCVVAKPAEQSSYSLLYVAHLAVKAGLPAGALNVLPGYGDKTGKAIGLHPHIRGIFFTGSSETGKKILEYSGQSNMKKVGLECGGKSAFILTENYHDLPHASEVLAKNIFYNQGQICSAPSRLIIHESIKERFMEELLQASVKYVPGDTFDRTTRVGSVVDKVQFDRIQAFIDKAEQGDYHIYSVGSTAGLHDKGLFHLPRIVDGVDANDALAQEEIFGPILVVISYSDISQAVAIANNSRFGLAASIWSDNLGEALSVSRQLEAGIVHINSYGDDDNSVPFGGVKESGIGKDKSLHAFNEYSQLKSTVIAYRKL